MGKKVLITGGAGFIGINAACYFAKKGKNITILDNFSRTGSRQNVLWLKRQTKSPISIINADVRNFNKKLISAVSQADLILHLAGQVAVTKSIKNPREDFESNALGTFNILEAMRISKSKSVLIYSSSNKVYGDLEHIKIIEEKTRYAFKNFPNGISENIPIDFHSPYGCSKGVGDQYVRDYARIYGLKTIVFRQSCIYGPHQFGIEDQGWLTWFIIAILKNKPITIYGNGKQVRDLLYVEDLVKAYDLAAKNISKTSGNTYNIGGGSKNAISIWIELKPLLENLFKKPIGQTFKSSRSADQKIFVADITKAKNDFGWVPRTNIETGIQLVYNWIVENKKLFT